MPPETSRAGPCSQAALTEDTAQLQGSRWEMGLAAELPCDEKSRVNSPLPPSTRPGVPRTHRALHPNGPGLPVQGGGCDARKGTVCAPSSQKARVHKAHWVEKNEGLQHWLQGQPSFVCDDFLTISR